jgi:hypothetical protein
LFCVDCTTLAFAELIDREFGGFSPPSSRRDAWPIDRETLRHAGSNVAAVRTALEGVAMKVWVEFLRHGANIKYARCVDGRMTLFHPPILLMPAVRISKVWIRLVGSG